MRNKQKFDNKQRKQIKHWKKKITDAKLYRKIEVIDYAFKRARLEDFSHSDIKRIERFINNYPRRLFGFKTSDQIFAA